MILNKEVTRGLPENVTLEQRLKEVKKQVTQRTGGRALQTAGTACAKAWGFSITLLQSPGHPAPQSRALSGEAGQESGAGGGWAGLAVPTVPTTWGSRMQTGVCGLASQGAGQEVLQVWGVGVFGLTLW